MLSILTVIALAIIGIVIMINLNSILNFIDIKLDNISNDEKMPKKLLKYELDVFLIVIIVVVGFYTVKSVAEELDNKKALEESNSTIVTLEK